jgi:hypothetical protein
LFWWAGEVDAPIPIFLFFAFTLEFTGLSQRGPLLKPDSF